MNDELKNLFCIHQSSFLIHHYLKTLAGITRTRGCAPEAAARASIF
jgi:hypothetical protein